MAPRRSKPLRRTAKGLDPRQRILVYLEGRNTETEYFRALRQSLRIPGVQFGSTYGEPLGVVKDAIAHKKRAPQSPQDKCEPYDEVWCVLDVEAPTPHGSIRPAVRLASDNGINVALSNPCFELWLLLHIKDHSAYLTSEKACRLLEAHGDFGYVRDAKKLKPEVLMDRLEAADTRARMLEKQHAASADPIDRNPSTSVWRLVEALRRQVDS